MDAITKAAQAHYPKYVSETIAEYDELFPTMKLGVYSGFEWNRVGQAVQLAAGNSVLDVGVGNGALLAMLWRSRRFRRVCGIDLHRMSQLRLVTPAEFQLMSVTEMAYADGEFDTVICMEVIEHLPIDQVNRALSELRRVARKRLIMTVPYKEPYPLFNQKSPSGHKQSFDDTKLRSLFPTATLTEILSRRVNWMLIVEERGAVGSRFQALKERIKRYFPGSHPLRRLFRKTRSLAGASAKGLPRSAIRQLRKRAKQAVN